MKILIIPDVHGRDFWIKPCSFVDNFDKIIFLGDYHDPYPFEVSKDTSRHRLRDNLVPFVKEHKDKCVCLFGNHDGNYIVGDMADRADYFHRKEIQGYLKQLDLKLIYRVGNYLFSHSGVLPSWLEANGFTLEGLESIPFDHQALIQVSPYRGGWGEAGSCVWGDLREYNASKHIPDLFQIFGHSWIKHELVMEDYACLDCQKAFVLDTETNILKPFEEMIQVKVLRDGGYSELPQYTTEQSAGLDLRSVETCTIPAHGRALIATGLFISLPKGYEAQIRPRSGLALKKGITVLNTPGTVDADYRGEIGVILFNTTDEDFLVERGERIAQMVVSRYEQIEWQEVDTLDETERGEGGFGHSGEK